MEHLLECNIENLHTCYFSSFLLLTGGYHLARMGTFRSTYPMMPESNRGTSTPHFAWFHPGNYLTATRNGFGPFQGALADPQGRISIPIRTIAPIDHEPTNNINVETEPTKPAKKPKTSKKTSNDLINPKEPKPKQSKKGPSKSTKVKRERKNLNFASYESSMDASGNPAPVCTCTGVARQCYRWGAGGWQSSCCTTNVSEYPLPMSSTRPGSRMAGRKMSNGAYDKLLQRLAAEGYDLTHPIDLKNHWARHGTNKFVIIK